MQWNPPAVPVTQDEMIWVEKARGIVLSNSKFKDFSVIVISPSLSIICCCMKIIIVIKLN